MYRSIKFSGTQGEGVDTVGEIMGAILHNMGYWIYGYRNFSSRIKGGYSSYEVTFAEYPVRVKKSNPDILVCLSPEGLARDYKSVAIDGIALVDERLNAAAGGNVVVLPFSKYAKDGPGEVYKWIIALGSVAGHLSLDPVAIKMLLTEMFSRKGENTIQKNIEALEIGLALTFSHKTLAKPLGERLGVNPVPLGNRRLIRGSDAIAEAALATGCNFTSGYPISPASEVFEYLAREFKDERGTAIQTEDEISALGMAIGASFAGATSMVTTSGPGLSLMVEGIGLAFMARIPVVLVNVQRSGPSTGMPSKHEQSDIELSLAGSHGDVSPLVFSPSSLEEMFQDLPQAFLMAEKHRTPVIFLTDFAMMVSRASIEDVQIPRVSLQELKGQRALPGSEGKMHHLTGNQAGHNGLPTELAHVRKELFNKHLEGLPLDIQDSFYYLGGGHELLIIAIGSARGAVEMAIKELKNGVSAIFPRVISPLPTKALAPLIEKHSKVLVIDGNAKGQLLKLFKTYFDPHDKFYSLKKYDGEPFTPEEVLLRAKEVLTID